MKLTRAQVEALKMLAVDDRQTARCSAFGYISGQTMAALVRRGFAFALPPSCAGERFYRVNIDGRLALEQLEMNAAMERLARAVERDMFSELSSEEMEKRANANLPPLPPSPAFIGLAATVKETP